jgi:CO/xanthine dehydrogenase Mo-binding subunit
VKIGAKKDGTLVAAKGDFYLQAGGLPGSPLRGPVGCAFAAYAIPNVLSTGYDVVSNRSKVAAYRAPGAPHGAFAAESVLDEIAQALGLDPLEMRLKNSVKAGDKAIYGPTFGEITFKETVEAIRQHPHYTAPLDKNPRPGVKRGRGVASGFWYNAGGESSVQVNITEDGNVLVTTGHPDVGGSRASISNVVAELLGVDHARVNVMIGDTQTIGFSNLTGGSRVTFASAMVATAATEKVIGQLRARAAKIWDIDAEAVKWEDGMALPAGDNAGKFPPLSLKELAAKANEMGGPIGNQTQLNTTGADPGFATHCVDVEVDVDLGIVRVLRYTAAQDVGRALHPAYVEGQIQGGVVQGIGWALSEEYLYDAKGRVDNASFLDYRMPVCSDVPMIEPIMLEIPNPKHPQGVRGVGEAPIVPPLAAIANAVHDALGVRFYDLPMSPPKVSARLDSVA